MSLKILAVDDEPAILDAVELALQSQGHSVVTAATGQDADTLRRTLAAMLHERFGIDHVTLQVEADHCGDACAVHARQGAHADGDHDGHDHGH